MSLPVSSETFRNAMSRLGAAVSIVTTDGEAGRHGLTASAVCSVTDSPATILVCINRQSSAHRAIVANGVLCINVLTPGHRELASRFGRSGVSPEEKYGDCAWSALSTGSPVLEGACVSLDCSVSEVRAVGTHSVFFCRVEAIASALEPEGLVYFDRDFHPLRKTQLPAPERAA